MPSLKKSRKTKGNNVKTNIQMKLKCLECRKVIINRQHFLARKRTCKCGYSTRCKQASALHRLLSPCSSNPANSIRWPFGMPPPQEQQKQQHLLACSICRFTSKSFEHIARHIGDCANHSTARIVIVATHVKIKLADQRAEHAEARLFGLFNMGNSTAAVNQGRCNDDALYNQLKQMMRPDHAALALTNAHLSKKYLGSSGNGGNNTAEKRQEEDSQQLLRLAFCNPEPMEKNKEAPSPVKLKASKADNKRSEYKRVAKKKETTKSDKNSNKRVLGKKNLMREVL